MRGLFGFFSSLMFLVATSTDMSSRFGTGGLFAIVCGDSRYFEMPRYLIFQIIMSQQTTEFAEFIALPAFLRHPSELLSLALDYAQAQCTAAHAFDGKSHDGPLTCHSNICRVHRWCSGDCVPGGSFASCCVCGNLICPACPRLSSLCTICFARLWPTSFRRICHRKL